MEVYLSIVLLIGLGWAMVFIPETLWKVEHIFTVKNGEPTEFYLACIRISGTFFIIIGFILFVISILK